MRALLAALAVLMLSPAVTAEAASESHRMCWGEAHGPGGSVLRVNHTFHPDGRLQEVNAWWRPSGNPGLELGPVNLTVVYDEATAWRLGKSTYIHVIAVADRRRLEGGRVILTGAGRTWSAPVETSRMHTEPGKSETVVVVQMTDLASRRNLDLLDHVDRLGRVRVRVEDARGELVLEAFFQVEPEPRDSLFPQVWADAAVVGQDPTNTQRCITIDR